MHPTCHVVTVAAIDASASSSRDAREGIPQVCHTTSCFCRKYSKGIAQVILLFRPVCRGCNECHRILALARTCACACARALYARARRVAVSVVPTNRRCSVRRRLSASSNWPVPCRSAGVFWTIAARPVRRCRLHRHARQEDNQCRPVWKDRFHDMEACRFDHTKSRLYPWAIAGKATR